MSQTEFNFFLGLCCLLMPLCVLVAGTEFDKVIFLNLTFFFQLICHLFPIKQLGPFGTLWGALENMYFLTCQYFPGQTGSDRLLKDTLLRYCRCVMKTLFLAGNNLDDLSMLVDRGMLTESEKTTLSQALVGTRPLVVIGII